MGGEINEKSLFVQDSSTFDSRPPSHDFTKKRLASTGTVPLVIHLVSTAKLSQRNLFQWHLLTPSDGIGVRMRWLGLSGHVDLMGFTSLCVSDS